MISLKQRRWVKEYLTNGGMATQAAVDAGYDVKNREVAQLIGHKNLRSPKVQTYMSRALERSGVSDEKIAESLNKVISAGTSKTALKKASTKDALTALDLSLKITGGYAPTRVETKNQNLNVNLDGKSQGELMDVLKNLKVQITNFQRVKMQADKIKAERKKNNPDIYADEDDTENWM